MSNISKSICNILKKNNDNIMYSSFIYTTTINHIYIGCVRYRNKSCRNFSLNSGRTLVSNIKQSQYDPLNINKKYLSKWTSLKNSINHINHIINNFKQIDTYI